MKDAYSEKDTAARCANCGSFMPWSRSRQVEKDTGIPAASPALVEDGICEKCEDFEPDFYHRSWKSVT